MRVPRGVLLFFLCICLLIAGMLLVDRSRAARQMRPIFSYANDIIEDGGTRYYYGLGYTVTDYDQLPGNGGRTDIVFAYDLPDTDAWEDISHYFDPHEWLDSTSITVTLLALVLLPISVAYLFHRALPHLRYLCIPVSVVAVYLAGVQLWGRENGRWTYEYSWLSPPLYLLFLVGIARWFAGRRRHKMARALPR